MTPQFLNNVHASFFFWAENRLLNTAQAYRNYSSRLYYTPDPQLDSRYVAYSAPFKQWVYDSSVAGAVVPSGITGANGIGLIRGQSGLKIDYNNGRVILGSGVGKNLNISGTYSFKEVNFYLPNDTEDAVLNNNKYYLNSRFGRYPTSGIAPNTFVTPAVFITPLDTDNDGFAMGGMEITEVNLSMVVYAETSYQMNGILSCFSDARNKSIPFVSVYDDPINEFGDLKSGYNYTGLAAERGTPGNFLLIDKVRATKLSNRTDSNPDVLAGIIQVRLTMPRYTT